MIRQHGWLLLWLSACVGTDTGNPAQNVEISACKSESAARGSGVNSQALRGSDASRYDGLACLEWQREAGRLHFAAYNFMGSCSVEWQGRASTRGQSVEFVVHNPSCAIAGCGSCLYDVSFELDTTQTKLASDAKVPLYEESCEGERTSLGSWQLQDADQGIACEHAKGLVWHAGKVGSCGRLHMPCRDVCGQKNADDCDTGLSCTQVGEHESEKLCLQTCSADSDCPLPEVTRCDGAVCRLL